MAKRKRKKFKKIVESRFYRNTQHRCGRCGFIPKILMKITGWGERRMCISCVKAVARNLGMAVYLPNKKQLKPKRA